METPLSPQSLCQYGYAFMDHPDSETLAILGALPSRWGRMPPLCRALVVETGRFLRNCALSPRQDPAAGNRVGLIGATARGSLAVDLDFARTLRQGVSLASPALFGYTLANIALAEAANHYHLTGPVYAVIDPADPLAAASREARLLLRMQPSLACIFACAFDDIPGSGRDNRLCLTFTLVATHA